MNYKENRTKEISIELADLQENLNRKDNDFEANRKFTDLKDKLIKEKKELEYYWIDKRITEQERIEDILSTLENISYQISELSRIKEILESRVNEHLNHHDDGSKTYVVGKYKVTVKTGYNYTLNKDEYEVIGSRLQSCFNPVKQKMSYELDKKVIRDCEKYGSKEDVLLLSQVISKKPAKLNIRISASC